MTTPAIDEVAPAPEITGPSEPARRTVATPPRWLWLTGIAVLVPVVVPLIALFLRVFGATDAAWAALWSRRTLELFVRSAGLTSLVTASAAAIGVAAAWLTVRANIPGRRTWAVLVALPLVVPSYVFGMAILSTFGPRGLIAELTGLSLPPMTGLPGAWLALTMSTYPYVFLVTAAALRRLDPAHEEAARSLGSGGWRAFRTVVLPQLRPAVGAGSLLVALYTLSDFGAVSLVRFDAFTRVIYAQYQGRIDRTPAAVLSAVLIVVALAVVVIEQRTRGRAAYFSPRPARRHRPVSLSTGGRIAGLIFLTVVLLAGLVLPAGVLTAWLVRGAIAGQSIGVRWGAVAGSLSGSVLAATLAIAAAIPIAVLSVRYRSRLGRWLERGVYVIFSLPHITVALAVVLFAASYTPAIYQSLGLLVVVYATLFLAQAAGTTRASLLQVNPHLEEASRSLGRGQLRTLAAVTIPLLRRGLVAGGLLVFLTTMKELPATLLLRPTGFDTLAIRIWSAADSLFYARSAASALLLLAISAVPMYLLVMRQHEAWT